MQRFAASSVLFHVLVVLVGYVGLPFLAPSEMMVDVPITVEVVTVTDKTNLPSAMPKPKAQKAEPQKTTKKIIKASRPAPPPPPPKPEPDVAAVATPDFKPKTKTKEKPKTQPKPKPTPKPKPEVKKQKPKAKPDAFASVLKSLEEMKQAPKAEKAPEEEKPKDAFQEKIAKALSKSEQVFDPGEAMTISEIDQVRRQISACWSLPAGAKDAENLSIEIRVVMNTDATVREARIVNQSRLGQDQFYRAAAESALRAVLNPACSPFKLPLDKYSRWQTMTLNFNPKEMFGL